VTSTDPNGPDTVALTGTGAQPVTVSPGNVNFGNVYQKKTSASQVVIFTNSSGSTYTFSGITISGGDSTQFAIDNTVVGRCNGTVASLATCTITLTMTPTTPGQKNSSLAITGTVTVPVVPLTGKGVNHRVSKNL
jgi:hypothetical protein